jgi:exodeoxyribonuclease-3
MMIMMRSRLFLCYDIPKRKRGAALKENYRFVSWNVNGIRSIGRKNALRWIDEDPPHILALQEVKAEKDEFPDDLFEHRYKHLFVNSSHRKGQSGVAVFGDIEPVSVSGCYEVDVLREGRIVEIIFDGIAFFNVYFPNGKRNEERLAYKLEFYERFLEMIEARRAEGFSVIFCGDINTAHRPIDLARPEENENISGFLPVEREWMDRLEKAGYIDTFRHVHPQEPERYSWWSMRTRARERNIGWRIDCFYVSADLQEYIADADILEQIHGSDHAPVTLRLTMTKNRQICKTGAWSI